MTSQWKKWGGEKMHNKCKERRKRDGIWLRKEAKDAKGRQSMSAQKWSVNKGFIDSVGFVCHHLTVGLWCMAASSAVARESGTTGTLHYAAGTVQAGHYYSTKSWWEPGRKKQTSCKNMTLAKLTLSIQCSLTDNRHKLISNKLKPIHADFPGMNAHNSSSCLYEMKWCYAHTSKQQRQTLSVQGNLLSPRSFSPAAYK